MIFSRKVIKADRDDECRSMMDQRNQLQQFQSQRPPPNRLSPIDPYTSTEITPERLAIRRKFDILQYRKNGNVTGGQTSSQRWATLVRNGKNITRWIPRPLPQDSSYTECDLVRRQGNPVYLDLSVPKYLYEDPLMREYADAGFENVIPEPLETYYYASVASGVDGVAPLSPWATLRFTSSIAVSSYQLRVSVPVNIRLAIQGQTFLASASYTVAVVTSLILYYNNAAVSTQTINSNTITLRVSNDTRVQGMFDQFLGTLATDEMIVPEVSVNDIYTLRLSCAMTFTGFTERPTGTVYANPPVPITDVAQSFAVTMAHAVTQYSAGSVSIL